MKSTNFLTTWKNGGFTVDSNRTINYVECHDNYTLFDKLAISYLNRTDFRGDLYKEIGPAGIDRVKKQDILCAAYIILAQGIPFINGGQEFMRTKMGDENSYISSDDINQIDFSFKEKNAEVFNFYKGLFELRRKNPQAFGHNADARACDLKPGLVYYESAAFGIYYNASSEAFAAPCRDYQFQIDLSSGTVVEKKLSDCVNAELRLEPLSFIILKK